MYGELVSATFFAPYDKTVEPYVRVSTGDYNELKEENGIHDALCMILNSLAHEIAHYEQWIKDKPLSDKAATRRAKELMGKYTQTNGICDMEIRMMKKTEIREMLIKCIEAGNLVRIDREKIDDQTLDGVPLMIGRDLLLLHNMYDFQIDGYKIIRIKDINNVRSNETDQFHEFILKEEGIYRQIKRPSILTIDSWGNLFKQLADSGKNIIVECEVIDDFNLGKIIEVKSKSLIFINFDALGEWDSDFIEVSFKDITSVYIDSRYATIMSKYTKPQ